MELIYGTTNPGKLNMMKELLCGTGIEITGLNELPDPPGEPGESGSTPLQNARGKAEYYFQALKRICVIFSETERYEHDGEDISGESFYLVDQAKPQKEKGFPLDCISVDPKTGRYFVDGGYDPDAWKEESGLRRFWMQVREAHRAHAAGTDEPESRGAGNR